MMWASYLDDVFADAVNAAVGKQKKIATHNVRHAIAKGSTAAPLFADVLSFWMLPQILDCTWLRTAYVYNGVVCTLF